MLSNQKLNKLIKEIINKLLLFESQESDSQKNEIFTNAQQRLENGEDPRSIFDYVGEFRDGFARVELNDKCNFINTDGEIISNQWFYRAGDFRYGFAPVSLNGKGYSLRQDGVLCDCKWKNPIM